jgi:tetratricopeptide (TPR) repeat protein
VLFYDPKRAAVHVNLGAIYNRLGQLDKAVESLRKGIQLDPHRAEGYYNLGLVYRTKKELGLAIQAYREAIRLNPRMADAHLNLANLLLDKEDFTQAKAHYQQALELAPNWDHALNGLARVERARSVAKAPTVEAAVAKEPTRVHRAWERGNDVVDQERHLDPAIHGEVLTGVHRLAIETEGKSLQFAQMVLEEIEPVIKEMSSCLLVHGGLALALDLDSALHKLDGAVENMLEVYGEIQSNLEQLRDLGEELLKK